MPCVSYDYGGWYMSNKCFVCLLSFMYCNIMFVLYFPCIRIRVYCDQLCMLKQKRMCCYVLLCSVMFR